MRLTFFVFSLAAARFLASPQHPLAQPQINDDLELWIGLQTNRLFGYILENIGGAGLHDKRVADGVVIASPSKENPNYFYTWVRDLALTMRSLVYNLQENGNLSLRRTIEEYIYSSYRIQRVPNRSGTFASRKGLGEPKMHPNLQPFEHVWGRPQLDGPGLRVSTIALYMEYLNRLGEEVEHPLLGSLEFIYYNIVRPDLEYIMANWKLKLFDLWEEVDALHFFNVATQLRALVDGSRLARAHGESTAFTLELFAAIDVLTAFLEHPASGFVTTEKPYIVASPGVSYRSGLDAAVLLAVICSHETSVELPFDVDHPLVLSTVAALVRDMRARYPVNKGSDVGLGRYPEDVYDGYGKSEGNPWFITTLAAAEVIYRWIVKMSTRDIVVTLENKAFFDLFSKTAIGTVTHGSATHEALLQQAFSYADLFVAVVRAHAATDGRMLEQFNRNTGFMQGARDLTWSYSAFYNCMRWRRACSHAHAA